MGPRHRDQLAAWTAQDRLIGGSKSVGDVDPLALVSSGWRGLRCPGRMHGERIYDSGERSLRWVRRRRSVRPKPIVRVVPLMLHQPAAWTAEHGVVPGQAAPNWDASAHDGRDGASSTSSRWADSRTSAIRGFPSFHVARSSSVHQDVAHELLCHQAASLHGASFGPLQVESECALAAIYGVPQ